jgi:hypothetical protein
MDKKKYQKSYHGYDCIGPCYKAGTTYMHPVTFKRMGSKKENTCPINETIIDNVSRYIDYCIVPDDNINTVQEELVPNIDISLKTFLSIYYNISTIDETYDYLKKNNHLSIYTKKRIVNCVLNIYELELVDQIIIDIFKEYCIKKIDIFEEKLDLSDIKNIKNNKEDKNKFIQEKLFTDLNINKFLGKIIESRRDIKDKNKNDYYLFDKFVDEFLIYLDKKIKK